jgi:hypothetical protein
MKATDRGRHTHWLSSSMRPGRAETAGRAEKTVPCCRGMDAGVAMLQNGTLWTQSVRISYNLAYEDPWLEVCCNDSLSCRGRCPHGGRRVGCAVGRGRGRLPTRDRGRNRYPSCRHARRALSPAAPGAGCTCATFRQRSSDVIRGVLWQENRRSVRLLCSGPVCPRLGRAGDCGSRLAGISRICRAGTAGGSI